MTQLGITPKAFAEYRQAIIDFNKATASFNAAVLRQITSDIQATTKIIIAITEAVEKQ